MPGKLHIQGRSLVEGQTEGPLLFSTVPLSFWGGTEPSTGEVIDRHHPLSGRCLREHVLAIPAGRGSCTGSVAMLELLLAGNAPLGVIVEVPEQIITIGVIVAKKLLKRHIPVVMLSPHGFSSLAGCNHVRIANGVVYADSLARSSIPPPSEPFESRPIPAKIELNSYDLFLLAKVSGNARGLAMEILVEFATLQGATSFVDVSQAHIDCCVYTGPASLLFAESMLGLEEAEVAVPTSMNSISIDQRRWDEIRMEPKRSAAANRLGSCYVKMGARPTFTCAPYLLETAPEDGQNVGWAESNAIVFANSVLGARTQKYPDFVDVCNALTGRAPLAGCHVEENRKSQLVLAIPQLSSYDESIFPLIGHCVGLLSGPNIPIVVGMESMAPSISDLKAFGAAFATTSSAAMFHIRGIIPEAMDLNRTFAHLKRTEILTSDLTRCWNDLNTAQGPQVALVALGKSSLLVGRVHLFSKAMRGTQKQDSDSIGRDDQPSNI